jgi:hypothetical protein
MHKQEINYVLGLETYFTRWAKTTSKYFHVTRITILHKIYLLPFSLDFLSTSIQKNVTVDTISQNTQSLNKSNYKKESNK